MNRFNRDYALIRRGPIARVLGESNDRSRLEQLRLELIDEGVACEIVPSDLPRSRASPSPS